MEPYTERELFPELAKLIRGTYSGDLDLCTFLKLHRYRCCEGGGEHSGWNKALDWLLDCLEREEMLEHPELLGGEIVDIDAIVSDAARKLADSVDEEMLSSIMGSLSTPIDKKLEDYR